MEHGADIVIHSATKFLGGHGTTLGGVVVESGRFDWGNGNFPQMTEPIPTYGGLSWWGNFREYGFLTRLRAEQLRDIGAVLSPHSAFLLLQGVETLPQRMGAHVANAQPVAEWLDADDPRRVGPLRGPARPSAPRSGPRSYLPEGPGAVFALRGAAAAAARRAAVHRVAWSCAATSPTSATRARWSSIPRRPPTSSSARSS